MSQSYAEKLLNIFITSRLDYCNAILAGCKNNSLKIHQLIQKSAAKVPTGTAKTDPISPIFYLF